MAQKSMEMLIVLLAAVGPLVLLICGIGCLRMSGARAARFAERAAWLAFAAAVMGSLMLAVGLAASRSGAAAFNGTIYVDTVSAAMQVLVSLLSAVVQRYSARYMAGEARQHHFHAWLAITGAAVLCVVIAGNLLLFVLAWLATSMSLHQLLIFYPNRPEAVMAAHKKFVVSRLGDVCLLGALVLVWQVHGTWSYVELLQQGPSIESGWSSHAIALLLVMGALLKSAQVPFHSWLPETMETPTPVSALMHAGIINAGGFLVIRFGPLISHSGLALMVLVVVGTITAIYASIVMLTQTSIKRSLAFSTVAQMGFMLLQCGLGLYALALLHILAHSLYKAHAFLSSGTIVEGTRQTRQPMRLNAMRPVRAISSLAFSVGAAILAAHLAGLDWLRDTGQIALAAVLAMSITQLWWAGLEGERRLRVFSKVLFISALVASAYFILHWAANQVWGAAVAPAAYANTLMIALAIGVVAAFAAALLLQASVAGQRGRFWTALHVHASHGFYMASVFTEALRRVWPVRESVENK